MLEKTKKKGGGLHWDIVLLCFINTLGAIFGGPWICAATVRGVAHVSALTVMSTTHAPGEAPHVVEVKGIFFIFKMNVFSFFFRSLNLISKRNVQILFQINEYRSY